jgi:hypothetical protein
MAVRSSLRFFVGLATFAFAMAAAYCMARVEAREQVSTVPVAALERLLPAPAGWTRADLTTETVVISADCSHPIAGAVYVQGDMRVKVMLADSGTKADSLMALAPMIVMLPDGYSETIPPATKVTRLQRNGAQVAERWDERKSTGEITMLFGGRFVVGVEGKQIAGLDTLRPFLAAIDLKQLSELK